MTTPPSATTVQVALIWTAKEAGHWQSKAQQLGGPSAQQQTRYAGVTNMRDAIMRSFLRFSIFLAALAWSNGATTQDLPARPAELSRGHIAEIQTLLIKSGFDTGSADGIVGPQTRAAVRAFETDIGKVITGQVSDELRGSLGFYLLLRKRVELYLAALGYKPGPVDGVVDAASKIAIRSFQASQKLPVDEKLSLALFDHVLRRVQHEPHALANLCERFYAAALYARAKKWCHAAAAVGIEKAKQKVESITIRSRAVKSPHKLFGSEKLTPRERDEIKGSIKATSIALVLTSTLLQLVTYEELKKGNCEGLDNIDRRAKQGEDQYQFILADLLHNGYCLKKNDVASARWLRRAAKQGHVAAQHDLGVYYLKGRGVAINLVSSAKWFKQAAMQGSIRSQLAIANIYSEGKGVIQDYVQALHWYKQAAAKGGKRAFLAIGEFYLKGKGVEVNFKEAFSWFLAGARKGAPSSQAMLASMYMDALGTSRNLIEAHKWANLAATSSIPKLSEFAVSVRQKAASKMTPVQVIEAQRLAKSWKPTISETEAFPATGKQNEQKLVNIKVAEPTEKLTPGQARDKLREYGIPITKDMYSQAVETDNLNVFKLFIAAGADIETTRGYPRGITALYDTVDFGSYKIFRYLMTQRANVNVRELDNGWTPLVRAISHDRWDMVEDLLESGADASRGNFPGGDILSGSALSYALMSSQPALVRLLLHHGASVRERVAFSDTILNWAIRQGHIENVRVLLKAGADFRSVGQYGRTPIHASLEKEEGIDKAMLALLLAAGANASQPNNSGHTPLFMATVHGNPGAVTLLVRYGANPNERYQFEPGQIPYGITDKLARDILLHGATPLMLAASLGHLSAVKVLMQVGANPKIRVQGKLGEHTAASLAKASGYPAAIPYLSR